MELKAKSSIHNLLVLKNYLEELLCTEHYPREIIYQIILFYYKVLRVKLWCNGHDFMMLCDGHVYSWSKQCTSMEYFKNNMNSHKLKISDVTKISSNLRHTTALTKDGIIYVWGSNDYGQLGLNSKAKHIYNPTVQFWEDQSGPHFLSNIIKIKTGDSHSIALSKSGEVYTWGLNRWGQLGLGGVSLKYCPIKIDLPPVKKISSGNFHSMALTTSNEVYVWGNNEKGQIGIGSNTDAVLKPQKIKLSPVKSIKCCYDYSMVITNCGEVYAWGHNTGGRLGLGTRQDIRFPEKMDLPSIRKIFCGEYHTMVITNNGEIWGWGVEAVWGVNRYCLLNTYKEKNMTTPQKLDIPNVPPIKEIICGQYYSIVVTEMNDIYIWGGNCGKFDNKFVF
jgi:alpha-tubulin suppressor-like RCC1 family protein